MCKGEQMTYSMVLMMRYNYDEANLLSNSALLPGLNISMCMAGCSEGKKGVS